MNVYHIHVSTGLAWAVLAQTLEKPTHPCSPITVCILFHLCIDTLRMRQSALLSAWYHTGQAERAIRQKPNNAGHPFSLMTSPLSRWSVCCCPHCHLGLTRRAAPH